MMRSRVIPIKQLVSSTCLQPLLTPSCAAASIAHTTAAPQSCLNVPAAAAAGHESLGRSLPKLLGAVQLVQPELSVVTAVTQLD